MALSFLASANLINYAAIIPCLAILVLVLVFMGAFTVGQQEAVIVQRLGKFQKVARAGLHFIIPFVDIRVGRVNLRIRELDIPGQFKTRDNVFVDIMIRVQYSILPERVADAYYKLTAPEQQITAFVLNTVRGEVAKMELREIFEHQDSVGDAVNQQLSLRMAEFGFEIHNSLVNEIQPASEVVRSLNAVMASENAKKAAQNEGEAHKLKTVLQAEADAEAKRLQGEGIAKQREAIVGGLSVSVESLKKAMPNADANDLMRLVLMNQYFDALRDISSGDKTKVIFVPTAPNSMNSYADQLMQGMMMAQEVAGTERGPHGPVPAPPRRSAQPEQA